MKEIKAIIRPHMLTRVMQALHALPHFPGVTVSDCQGQGRGRGSGGGYEATEETICFAKMTKLELFWPAKWIRKSSSLPLQRNREYSRESATKRTEHPIRYHLHDWVVDRGMYHGRPGVYRLIGGPDLNVGRFCN